MTIIFTLNPHTADIDNEILATRIHRFGQLSIQLLEYYYVICQDFFLPELMQWNITEHKINNDPIYLLFFVRQLTAILREVHYLNLMEHKDIPEEAIHIYERSETFRKYTSNLNQSIQW